MAEQTPPNDRVVYLRAAYSDEQLRSLAAEWRQAAADYTATANRTDIQEWWRRDRRDEARRARLNAADFEAALGLSATP